MNPDNPYFYEEYPKVQPRLNALAEIGASETDAALDFNEVFNTKKANQDLTFLFESKFDPYQQWAYGDIGNIDLVIILGISYFF